MTSCGASVGDPARLQAASQFVLAWVAAAGVGLIMVELQDDHGEGMWFVALRCFCCSYVQILVLN